MRILLVEDDEMIGEGVVDGLKAEGYAVDWVQDGNSALIALRTTPFSLVILAAHARAGSCDHGARHGLRPRQGP